MPHFIVSRREVHTYEMEYRVLAADETHAQDKVRANHPDAETWKQYQITVEDGPIHTVEED